MHLVARASFLVLMKASCAAVDAPGESLGVASVAASVSDPSEVPDEARLLLTVPATEARRQARGTSAPVLPITYHGGPVIPMTKVAAIYWGDLPIFAGGPTPGTTGPGSADTSVVGDFLKNLGGSPYWLINSDYTDQSGRRVGTPITYTQFWAATPAPNPIVNDKAVRAQITAGLVSGQLTYDRQTVYLVFSGPGVNLGAGFGTAYCAYHYFFFWGTKSVVYAVLPWAQQYPGVCTRLQGSPNNDFGADALATPIAHEVEEAATDPGITSWYDVNKDENADKCAWTFGSTYPSPNGALANIQLGNRHYLVQQNWKLPVQGCAMS